MASMKWVKGTTKTHLSYNDYERGLFREVPAIVCGVFAIHYHKRYDGKRQGFALTSTTTGRRVAVLRTQTAAKRMAAVLSPWTSAFEHTEAQDIVNALPQWVSRWVRQCQALREIAPMDNVPRAHVLRAAGATEQAANVPLDIATPKPIVADWVEEYDGPEVAANYRELAAV
jgi:hypothetical protein